MDDGDWRALLQLEQDLCSKLKNINFYEPPSKIAYVYNPIDYAIQFHLNFISRFFSYPKKVLFVGMNPGPFGMAQTGVPFGDVVTVREWMKVEGNLENLPLTHSSKPIRGLECTRTEVSGARFWGLFWKTLELSPAKFFENCFVLNVCPLLFLDANGKNVSMPEVKASIRHQIESLCGSFLIEVLKLMEPEIVVGVGQYAAVRIQKVVSFLQMENQRIHELKLPTVQITPSTSEPCSTTRPNKVISQCTQSRSPSKEGDDRACNSAATRDSDRQEQFSEGRPTPTADGSASTAHEKSPSVNSTVAENFPKVYTLMHPSPANPAANKGWDGIALKQLKDFGVLDLIDSKLLSNKNN